MQRLRKATLLPLTPGVAGCGHIRRQIRRTMVVQCLPDEDVLSPGSHLELVTVVNVEDPNGCTPAPPAVTALEAQLVRKVYAWDPVRASSKARSASTCSLERRGAVLR